MSVVSRARVARRRVLVVLAVVLVGLLAATAVAHHHLFGQLTRFEGAFSELPHRPAHTGGDALNVLLIGADQRPTSGPASAGWLPGAGAQAVLLVHVAADRSSGAVVSLPLDTRVPDASGGSLAAAVAQGPAAAVGAVESFTDVRVDHVAVLDWSLLADLPGGDSPPASAVSDAWGRAAADQAYLRSVAESTLHAELRKQPRTVYRIAGLTTAALAVDDSWSSFDLARFAVSLRSLRSADLAFVVAVPEDHDLWQALKDDDADRWVTHHAGELVGSAA